MRHGSLHGGSAIFLLRRVATFSLLFLLAACGTSVAGSSSPTRTPTNVVSRLKPTSPASAGAQSGDSLAPNAMTINTQVGNLSIQTGSDGFQCPEAIPGDFTSNQIVLASDRLTYSSTELQQMLAFFQRNPIIPSRLPSTLSMVLGGSQTPIPGTYENRVPCQATLNIANQGTAPITLKQMGVQLTAAPQTNTRQYRLINYCSLLAPTDCACPQCSGGGNDCTDYVASISLGPGIKGTPFSSDVVSAAPGCNPAVINPGDQLVLTVNFSLAGQEPDNLIYNVMPELTVDAGQGKQVISLAPVTLAFANPDQFSCYTLHGQTFVVEPKPVFDVDVAHIWCV